MRVDAAHLLQVLSFLAAYLCKRWWCRVLLWLCAIDAPLAVCVVDHRLLTESLHSRRRRRLWLRLLVSLQPLASYKKNREIRNSEIKTGYDRMRAWETSAATSR